MLYHCHIAGKWLYNQLTTIVTNVPCCYANPKVTHQETMDLKQVTAFNSSHRNQLSQSPFQNQFFSSLRPVQTAQQWFGVSLYFYITLVCNEVQVLVSGTVHMVKLS